MKPACDKPTRAVNVRRCQRTGTPLCQRRTGCLCDWLL